MLCVCGYFCNSNYRIYHSLYFPSILVDSQPQWIKKMFLEILLLQNILNLESILRNVWNGIQKLYFKSHILWCRWGKVLDLSQLSNLGLEECNRDHYPNPIPA